MKIVTGRPGESLVIDEHINIVILASNEHRVRLGIIAPAHGCETKQPREKMVTSSRRSGLQRSFARWLGDMSTD